MATKLNPIIRELIHVAEAHPSTATFKVLTYNVLGQTLIKRVLYAHASKAALTWNHRRELLAPEVLAYHADIITLQEVDKYEEYWLPIMTAHGYKCAIVEKKKGARVGCAVFWNHRFREVLRESINFDEDAMDPASSESTLSSPSASRSPSESSSSNTTTASSSPEASNPSASLNVSPAEKNKMNPEFLEDNDVYHSNSSAASDQHLAHDRKFVADAALRTGNVGVMVALALSDSFALQNNASFSSTSSSQFYSSSLSSSRDDGTGETGKKSSPNCLIVSTAHLYWAPDSDFLRLRQALYLRRRLAAFSAKTAPLCSTSCSSSSSSSINIPIIFGGDLNSTPDSAAYLALTGQYAEVEQLLPLLHVPNRDVNERDPVVIGKRHPSPRFVLEEFRRADYIPTFASAYSGYRLLDAKHLEGALRPSKFYVEHYLNKMRIESSSGAKKEIAGNGSAGEGGRVSDDGKDSSTNGNNNGVSTNQGAIDMNYQFKSRVGGISFDLCAKPRKNPAKSSSLTAGTTNESLLSSSYSSPSEAAKSSAAEQGSEENSPYVAAAAPQSQDPVNLIPTGVIEHDPCNEPVFTIFGSWNATLDYILFSLGRFHVHKLLRLPAAAELEPGLPNDQYVSDHLPMLAELSFADSS